ncbi:hypothetical protein SDC9_45915 [bioreactor metagenome]|uniref:DUF3800 domain-containing protein n=1 Tax=bioreactor metagenome TaxID=1076179 RepID=A0A644W7E9_9ZZZZ
MINDKYQLTSDDQYYIEKIVQPQDRTAFIDESGGFGFDFSKAGTSKYYVICAVVVKNTIIHSIEEKVSELRRKFFSGGELKSSSIGSNHKRRHQILLELLPLEFSIFVIIVNKMEFYEGSILTSNKKSFIKYLHKELYEAMRQYYPNLTIIEDEHGGKEFQKGFKEYVYNNQPQPDLFNNYSFKFTNSKNTNIVQIADIIAGSINKYMEGSTSINALRILKEKISGRRIDFPHTIQQFYRTKKNSSSFDREVSLVAFKSVNDYIENNKGIEDEEIRLRVILLKFLLFRIQYTNDAFVYSQDIVESLNEIAIKKVTRNILYRRIIAPLRDQGVLIASSPHGYKIPTSVKDISTYINQTVSIVGPMLSRIEKCREIVMTITDDKLDVLADPTLSGYKAYFDSKRNIDEFSSS